MESADKFFTLTCTCGNEYCPEVKQACTKCDLATSFSVGMKFDVDSFLSALYDYISNSKNEDALDVALDAYFNFWNRFDIMDEIYQKVDLKRISKSLMICMLAETRKYSSRFPGHAMFFEKAREELARRGEDEKGVKKLIGNLISEGDYWENMKLFGATGPEWGCRSEEK